MSIDDMTKLLPDTLILLGAVLIPAGLAMIHLAAACVVAGIELILIGAAYQGRRTHGTSG